MRVLVLGGNGFIGSHFVDDLLRTGCRVRVFDRVKEHYRNPLPGVEYVFGQFGDVPDLAEALEGVDVVCHLISTTVPSTSNLDPLADVEGNLLNSIRLLQLMVQKNVSRIVYLSSGGTVYGVPIQLPIHESHPLNPVCSYGVVKGAIEHYIYMFHHLHGIEYCILRASNPYGERQGHSGVQGVIGTFGTKILNGDPIEIWGDGNVVRDFIYAGDLSFLNTKACLSHVTGVFNAGSGKGISINEIINFFKIITNMPVTLKYKESRAYDVPKIVLDISMAQSTFDWKPSLGIQEGVQQTWDWILSEVK